MKNFFSLDYYRELKVLCFLEIAMLLLGILLYHSDGSLINVLLKNRDIFNMGALILSFLPWILSSLLEPKKSFNFFTLIFTVPFFYGCFWFMITILN